MLESCTAYYKITFSNAATASLFPSTTDPVSQFSFDRLPLPSYSPLNIPTDVSTKKNFEYTKESKKAKECGAKGGWNACCPGLACHHHQNWRHTQGKILQTCNDYHFLLMLK